MRKLFLTLILAAFCGMSSAFAYDFSAVCSTEQTLYYNIIDAVNHEVELTHPNNSQNIPWHGFTEPAGEIELPSLVVHEGTSYTVTRIGEKAFYSCYSLTGDLFIPNSVTEIGESAFYECYGFTGKLTITDAVTSVEQWAFSECSGITSLAFNATNCISMGNDHSIPVFTGCYHLTSLTIGENVTNIPDYAFKDCYYLNCTLDIPTSVTSIGDYAFSDCRCLTGELIIPSSVTAIGKYAFQNCESFSGNLVIPNSVTKIEDRAFYSCSGLSGSLTIPNSVISIGHEAFGLCSGLTGSLIIPESVKTIGESAFYYCSGFTGNLSIPNSIISIGKDAFAYCTGFTGDLVIPNSIRSIESHTFHACIGLDGNLVIPESVTTIGEYAFAFCSSLTGDLVIPKSVTLIEEAAFDGCTGFTGALVISNPDISIHCVAFDPYEGFSSLVMNCITPPSLSDYCMVLYDNDIPVFVPCGAISTYQEAAGWKNYTNYQEHYNLCLTVSSENETFGTVTILQQPDCETDAIVEATPNEGCLFVGWRVDGEIVSAENPYAFTLTEDTEIVAVFSGMGVDDNELIKTSVYPNPTSGFFIVEGEDIEKIEVYNAMGQLILTKTASDGHTKIDLGNASSGMYLVRVTGKNGTTERNVVKR